MIAIRSDGKVKVYFQIGFVIIARVSANKISFSNEEMSIQALKAGSALTLNSRSEKEGAHRMRSRTRMMKKERA